MIYAFDPRNGWQCPHCGYGKMAQFVLVNHVMFTGGRRCMKCAFTEWINVR